MINFHHKFTIIHTPKFGGSSLHFLFMQHGLYPPGAMELEPNRNGENECLDPTETWKKKYAPRGPHGNLQHRVNNLRKIGEDPQDYTFIFLRRNPWDFMVSWYFWVRRNAPWDRDSFAKFVTAKSHEGAARALNMQRGYQDYNSFFVDINHQLRDINIIFSKWDIQFDDIPRKNKSLARKDSDDYKQYYDDTTREIVATAFKDYIKLFDYKF